MLWDDFKVRTRKAVKLTKKERIATSKGYAKTKKKVKSYVSSQGKKAPQNLRSFLGMQSGVAPKKRRKKRIKYKLVKI